MSRFLFASTIVAVAALAFVVTPARAHFIYLKQSAEKNGTKVEGFFGHAPEPDEPRLLANLEGLEVWWTPAKGERVLVPLSLGADRMTGSAPAGPGMLSAKKDSGVREREGVTYRSFGFALALPPLESETKIDLPDDVGLSLRLDAQRTNEGKLRVMAFWKGTSLRFAEIEGTVPGLPPIKTKTDQFGVAEFPLDEPGVIALHVKHVFFEEGELDGKKFTETRHNATLVVETAGKSAAAAK